MSTGDAIVDAMIDSHVSLLPEPALVAQSPAFGSFPAVLLAGSAPTTLAARVWPSLSNDVNQSASAVGASFMPLLSPSPGQSAFASVAHGSRPVRASRSRTHGTGP